MVFQTNLTFILIYGCVYLLLDRLESLVILGNSFLVVLEVWVEIASGDTRERNGSLGGVRSLPLLRTRCKKGPESPTSISIHHNIRLVIYDGLSPLR